MNSMKVVFRVDASSFIGSGHIMRCLTLAKAMQSLGWQVCFLSKPYQGHLIEWLVNQGIKTIELPIYNDLGNVFQEQKDADDCLAVLREGIDLLIVDNYDLAQNFCRQLRQKTKLTMVIDDLAKHQHDCDLLLDQNLFSNTLQRYQGKVNKSCQLLLGPQYVLLRDEFYMPLKKIDNKTKRLLVYFSAADPNSLTMAAIRAVSNLKDIKLLVDIVINNSHPQQANISRLCHNLDNVTLHIQTTKMAQLMVNADLMLGAGGSTHWERCFLGLPALVVTLADNQVETTRYLHQLGVCEWLGHFDCITETIINQQIRLFIQAPELLINMRKAAKKIMGVGDSGTVRVIQAIEARLAC